MKELRRGIPTGKTRVIYVDLFSSEDGIVGDYDKREDAFKIADENNRERTGSMDTVYYVYDDKGNYIRGNESVGELGVSP